MFRPTLALWALLGLLVAMPLWALELRGELIQGGLVIGSVTPATQVRLDGRVVRVSPQGDFVLGFGRNAEPRSSLQLRYPDGRALDHTLQIMPRTYQVQRIDGLPPAKVTPSVKDLERIKREQALINAARRRDDPRTDFLQGFIWPAKGRISGVYGSQRILNGKPRRPHYGLDIAAPRGTPVRAPAAGVVSLVHKDMYFTGGTVILDHGHGLSSVFIHLSKVHVAQGDRLAQGALLGEVGATGRATGPHLHWGMNLFQQRLDPQLLVPPLPTDRGQP